MWTWVTVQSPAAVTSARQHWFHYKLPLWTEDRHWEGLGDFSTGRDGSFHFAQAGKEACNLLLLSSCGHDSPLLKVCSTFSDITTCTTGTRWV